MRNFNMSPCTAKGTKVGMQITAGVNLAYLSIKLANGKIFQQSPGQDFVVYDNNLDVVDVCSKGDFEMKYDANITSAQITSCTPKAAFVSTSSTAGVNLAFVTTQMADGTTRHQQPGQDYLVYDANNNVIDICSDEELDLRYNV